MPTNQLISRFVRTGTRLMILATVIVAMISNVARVSAAPAQTLQTVTVGVQSGSLTYGVAGAVTFTVSVLRSGNNPGNFTLAVTGLPSGASVSAQSPANPVSFVSNPIDVVLTVQSDGSVGAGAFDFTVQASGQGPSRSGTGTLSVSKADQTITFDPLPDRTVGDADFTVSATASSGLPVTFAAGGACSVVGNLVQISSYGSCWITASQAGDANYLAASNVVQGFTILPAAGTFAGFDLYAVSGSTALPDQTVTVWGYNDTGAPASMPGGPSLIVNQGDAVVVTLHNMLSEPTAILFQGQEMVPDTAGVAAGGSKTYIFTANRPGTYLYEAGLLPNAEHQIAMGLYGALIVRPAAANQAYESAGTTFNDEAVLVLSDIDPALNNSVDPAAFDIRGYAPKYFLINGKVYPGTDAIPTMAGNTLLLRYVNAGLQAYSMSLLGLRQTAIAMDGSPFTNGRTLVAETIATGQTADMLVTIPAAAADGTRFALFDGNLMLHNNKANNNLAGGFGGMLTFLTATGTPPSGDTTGPATANVVLTPSSVAATVSDAGRGDSNVTAAEFFVDVTGTSGSGTPMTGAFGAVSVNVSAAIAPALTGSHTVYVHGVDAAGNWGPFQSALISNDTTGPTTSGLTLSPNPSNGTVDVMINGTADDTASGGSTIAAAEYSIDGGAAQTMAITPAGAPVASLSAAIPAATVNALPAGVYVVAVRSQDSLGNWGAATTINLTVDKLGPTTSNVNAAPNPNNGMLGINSSTPAMRVTADFTGLGQGGPGCIGSASVTVASAGQAATNHLYLPALASPGGVAVRTASVAACPTAEAFIDTVGAPGTGAILLPSDGLYDTDAESGYADIPLTTIALLTDGAHTIYVRARDTAGNWGDTNTTTLTIDKTPPTIASVSLSADTIAVGNASVNLSVTASDAGVGVAGGQYWIDGSATPPANAVTFSGTAVQIDTSALAGGTHTVYVRMRDTADNWSTVASATLYVVQAINDTQTIVAGTGATQISDTNAANGVLANDQPVNVAGRTATLLSAPVRTSGNGAGTLAVSCPASLGTPATPSIGANTICTNGAYRVTLNGVGNNNNQRRNSKRGTFQFTYTETLNGVPSTATVTITVN